MKRITGLLTGLLVLGLLFLIGPAMAQEEIVVTDDIEPYNGPIGADSPLYGLKLALEDMDESFTANETERVDKQLTHGRLRLSEVRRSLALNQSDSAEQALNNYWLKMDLANATIARWNSNTSGLLHAQEQIVKHQLVLANLLASRPNNTGLQRAYNNSLRLEERFAERTAVKFDRVMQKNNQTILKAIRLEQKEHNRNGWPDTNGTVTTTPADKGKGPDKDKNKGKGSTDDPVTTVTTATPTASPHSQLDGQGNQPDDKQKGSNGNGAGNNDDKAKGNSRNK
jgi:hypothetical protein